MYLDVVLQGIICNRVKYQDTYFYTQQQRSSPIQIQIKITNLKRVSKCTKQLVLDFVKNRVKLSFVRK